MYLCIPNNQFEMLRNCTIPLALLALCLFQTARAQLVFDPAEWDFGTIEESDGRVTYTFTGENLGEDPVVILDVVTSCGCTVPEFLRKPVLPGEKTRITVTFDPTNRPGTFSKDLDVYSSQRRKIATLGVRGTVAPRPRSLAERYPVDAGGGLRLDGTLCAFTYIYPGQQMQSAVGYANTSARELTLELRSQAGSGVLTTHYPRRIAPGEEGQIGLAYLVPSGEPRYGTLRDALEVLVDGRSNGTTIVAHGIGVDNPADADPQNSPRFEPEESIVRFGAVKRGAPVQRRTLRLTNAGQGELVIRAVENRGHYATTLAPGQRIAAGETLSTELLLDPAFHDYGILTDHLVIITNDPQRPMRRVRVTAIIEN